MGEPMGCTPVPTATAAGSRSQCAGQATRAKWPCHRTSCPVDWQDSTLGGGKMTCIVKWLQCLGLFHVMAHRHLGRPQACCCLPVSSGARAVHEPRACHSAAISVSHAGFLYILFISLDAFGPFEFCSQGAATAPDAAGAPILEHSTLSSPVRASESSPIAPLGSKLPCFEQSDFT